MACCLRRAFALGLTCLVLGLASGCVSYRTGALPRVAVFPQHPGKPNQTAMVSIRCWSQTVVETVPRDNTALAQEVRPIVARVLDDCGYFKSCSFSPRAATHSDVQIFMDLERKEGGWLPMAVLCGATLCILPCTWTESYYLAAEVKGNGTQAKRQYNVEDSMRNWVQICLLPLGPWKSPGKVEKELVENMIRTLVVRMEQDGILQRTE